MPESASISLLPAISVVVAAHDEELALPHCLASLRAAASAIEAPIEILVVDNQSSDRTAEVARAWAGVRVIECATLGAVHAKSAGVAAARAPLVAVLDADSTCPSDWLCRIERAFADEPGLVGLSGKARYRTSRTWVHATMWLWYAWWNTIAFLAGKAFYATGTNVAFRREAYLCTGGFDTNVLVGGDEIALFHRLRAVGMTRFSRDLTVETDARRTDVGFLSFFASTVMARYVFNYTLYRITGRSFVKGYLPGSKLGPESKQNSNQILRLVAYARTVFGDRSIADKFAR